MAAVVDAPAPGIEAETPAAPVADAATTEERMPVAHEPDFGSDDESDGSTGVVKQSRARLVRHELTGDTNGPDQSEEADEADEADADAIEARARALAEVDDDSSDSDDEDYRDGTADNGDHGSGQEDVDPAVDPETNPEMAEWLALQKAQEEAAAAGSDGDDDGGEGDEGLVDADGNPVLTIAKRSNSWRRTRLFPVKEVEEIDISDVLASVEKKSRAAVPRQTRKDDIVKRMEIVKRMAQQCTNPQLSSTNGNDRNEIEGPPDDDENEDDLEFVVEEEAGMGSASAALKNDADGAGASSRMVNTSEWAGLTSDGSELDLEARAKEKAAAEERFKAVMMQKTAKSKKNRSVKAPTTAVAVGTDELKGDLGALSNVPTTAPRSTLGPSTQSFDDVGKSTSTKADVATGGGSSSPLRAPQLDTQLLDSEPPPVPSLPLLQLEGNDSAAAKPAPEASSKGSAPKSITTTATTAEKLGLFLDVETQAEDRGADVDGVLLEQQQQCDDGEADKDEEVRERSVQETSVLTIDNEAPSKGKQVASDQDEAPQSGLTSSPVGAAVESAQLSSPTESSGSVRLPSSPSADLNIVKRRLFKDDGNADDEVEEENVDGASADNAVSTDEDDDDDDERVALIASAPKPQKRPAMSSLARQMMDMEAEENDEEADIEMYGQVRAHKLPNKADSEDEGDDSDLDQDLKDLIDAKNNFVGKDKKVSELHDKWGIERDQEDIRAVVRGIKTGQWRRKNGGMRGGLDEDDEDFDLEETFVDDEEAAAKFYQMLANLRKRRKKDQKLLNTFQNVDRDESMEDTQGLETAEGAAEDENNFANALSPQAAKKARRARRERKRLLRERSRMNVELDELTNAFLEDEHERLRAEALVGASAAAPSTSTVEQQVEQGRSLDAGLATAVADSEDTEAAEEASSSPRVKVIREEELSAPTTPVGKQVPAVGSIAPSTKQRGAHTDNDNDNEEGPMLLRRMRRKASFVGGAAFGSEGSETQMVGSVPATFSPANRTSTSRVGRGPSKFLFTRAGSSSRMPASPSQLFDGGGRTKRFRAQGGDGGGANLNYINGRRETPVNVHKKRRGLFADANVLPSRK